MEDTQFMVLAWKVPINNRSILQPGILQSAVVRLCNVWWFGVQWNLLIKDPLRKGQPRALFGPLSHSNSIKPPKRGKFLDRGWNEWPQSVFCGDVPTCHCFLLFVYCCFNVVVCFAVIVAVVSMLVCVAGCREWAGRVWSDCCGPKSTWLVMSKGVGEWRRGAKSVALWMISHRKHRLCCSRLLNSFLSVSGKEICTINPQILIDYGINPQILMCIFCLSEFCPHKPPT